ncbi:mitochondrial uncoupling protein 4 isoform X3 [Myotis daubentonii]|uniref:mitochondrial uncoupling protein 4 isoform X3 n=1 Tax=Myotis daubentonii TaxID=98922 RepID=UPI0028735A22|nr:mitochondrial uncoupling protein 4 isoform X3 [Myotis daubentonii]
MAPSEQLRTVGLRGHRGRASNLSPRSHKNSTPNARRSCPCSAGRQRKRIYSLQGHGAHSPRDCPRGRLSKALARSDTCHLQTLYSGGRMVTYEHLREVVFRKNEDQHYPLWKSVIGGMFAGVVGQFLANPTDLVKVQMQMEGKRKLEGKPLRFRGVHHAFAKILAEGGIRGLWAGWVPNVQRAALVNMGDLTTYDTVKHYLVLNTTLEDNIMTHSLSSFCSGLVASILGTPADVIKSRIMNQPRDKQGRGLLYKSSTDCLIQAVQGEGFMSLYKGFLPSWLRMTPWSLVFWLTYEKIREMSGVNPF